MKHLATSLLIVGATIAAISCNTPKSDNSATPESGTATTQQAVGDNRTENIAQAAKPTPDQAFFNVKGNVKSITYPEQLQIPTYMFSTHQPVEFNEDGSARDLVNFFNYDPDNKNSKMSRTQKGEIDEFSMNLENFDGGWSFECEWTDGRMTGFVYSSPSTAREVVITYDDKGNVIEIDENEETQISANQNTYRFSNFKYDDRGNWTECDVEIEIISDDAGDADEVSLNKHIRRIIEYYP